MRLLVGSMLSHKLVTLLRVIVKLGQMLHRPCGAHAVPYKCGGMVFARFASAIIHQVPHRRINVTADRDSLLPVAFAVFQCAVFEMPRNIKHERRKRNMHCLTVMYYRNAQPTYVACPLEKRYRFQHVSNAALFKFIGELNRKHFARNVQRH